jgi:hypothetical protein
MAHAAAARNYPSSHRGMNAALFHLASELNSAGHCDAARWVVEQLNPKVVPLRPPEPGGAA